MNCSKGQIKGIIADMMTFVLLGISSLYIGLLVSLHFIWYPQWDYVNPANIDIYFNQPVERAVFIFRPLVGLMIVSAVVLIIISGKGINRLILLLILGLIITFAFISAKYIVPLNAALMEAHNSEIIKVKIVRWMKFNDYRMYLIFSVWILICIKMLNKKPFTASPNITSII